MNKPIIRFVFAAVLPVLFLLSSCDGGNFDKDGRLKIENLTSTGGDLKMNAMIRSTANDALEFIPDTFMYKGKPYTGAIAQYANDTLATISGNLKDGLMDGEWIFRFKSGGIVMEGAFKNGKENGLWRSYYGYNKPKVDKLYDERGVMLMRKEYYNNGDLKNYQNIKCPQFGNSERRIDFNSKGNVDKIQAEDSLTNLSGKELMYRIESGAFEVK